MLLKYVLLIHWIFFINFRSVLTMVNGRLIRGLECTWYLRHLSLNANIYQVTVSQSAFSKHAERSYCSSTCKYTVMKGRTVGAKRPSLTYPCHINRADSFNLANSARQLIRCSYLSPWSILKKFMHLCGKRCLLHVPAIWGPLVVDVIDVSFNKGLWSRW